MAALVYAGCTDVSDDGDKYRYSAVDNFLGIYKVRFYSNSDNSRNPELMTVIPGDSITLPDGSGLVRNNYVFDGWNTGSDGNGKNYAAGSSYKPDGSVTLYAKWKPMYTVTFLGNNGTGTVPAAITVISGDSITLPSGDGLTRNEYVFGGWNTGSYGNGTNYAAGSSYKPDGFYTTLYANWIALYKITFSGSSTDAVPAAIYVIPGDSITLPNGDGLTSTIYYFGGWTTASNGSGTNYSAGSSYKPTGNTTLYVKWNPKYNVTFRVDYTGTNYQYMSVYVMPDDSITLPNGDGLTRVNYYFIGWNTGGTNYAAGSSYKPDGNVTFSAEWNPKYSVTFYLFDTQGKHTGSLPSMFVIPGDSITLPIINNQTSNYIFYGWSTSSDGSGTSYAADSYYKPDGDVTLYTKWIRMYKVTFAYDYYGGKQTAWYTEYKSEYVMPGDSITMPDGSGLTYLSDYYFDGWNMNSTGSGTNYAVGSYYKQSDRDVTLYAKWSPKYRVYFHPNNGYSDQYGQTFWQTLTMLVIPGDSITLPYGGGFAKEGYSFGGWNTQSDGYGVTFEAGSSYKPNANISLYIKWNPIVDN